MTTGLDQSNERETLTIAISGSSGLIGSALVRSLEADGHRVLRIVRHTARDANEIVWDQARDEIDVARLSAVDAVVNLAGESLDQRWSDDVKRRIRESRVKGTTAIARALATLDPKPRVLVSGSAIGIYGDRGDEVVDESSALGDGFLASVCREWEAATQPAEDAGIRVVHSRTGVVLAKEGGALTRMMTPFRFGVGGKLGSGKQWMSWIALPDMVRALRFAITTGSLRGAANLVAPNPVRNAELAEALGREMHRPSIVAVPKVALELVLGEMADAAVLASQRVKPAKLSAAGFAFELPTLEQALAALL